MTTNEQAQPATSDSLIVREFAQAALAEQRRARRWNVFFKLLLFLYLFSLMAMYFLGNNSRDWSVSSEPHTALVEIDGVIAQNSAANADNVVTGLRRAFEHQNTAGVILRINSPGGSPVQSGYINDEITRLRAEYPDIILYAVVMDICASGGYYIAAAADRIYADKASFVGSIGVRMDSFGFVQAMDKLGVERRLLTAGEHKGFLDPFLPLRDADVEHVHGVLDEVHEQFIATVKRGRGDKLKSDDSLFSGLIWTGEGALELGLIDELGSAGHVAREVIGAEKIVDFTVREDYLTRFTRQLGTAMATAMSEVLFSQLPRH